MRGARRSWARNILVAAIAAVVVVSILSVQHSSLPTSSSPSFLFRHRALTLGPRGWRSILRGHAPQAAPVDEEEEEEDARNSEAALVGVGCRRGERSASGASGAGGDCRAPLVRANVTGCRDLEAPTRCAEWASTGQCESNADYMARQCAAACGQCWAYRTRRGASLDALRLGRRRRPGPLLPAVGFGTAGLGSETRRAVLQALELGYGMVDTAAAREWYRQDEVGDAVREWRRQQAAAGAGASGNGGSSSSSIGTPFLVTKIHPRDLGYEATLAAGRAALRELGGAPSVGLLLLHYPRCWRGVAGCADVLDARREGESAGGRGDSNNNEQELWKESWRALVRLRDVERVADAIGVSNFGLDELRALLRLEHEVAQEEQEQEEEEEKEERREGSGKPPPSPRPTDVDAIEVRLDPLDASTAAVVREALGRGVAVLAYSTLGTQHRGGPRRNNPVLSSPTLARIGRELGGRSPAQVALRWALQRGAAVIPASRSRAHAADNLRAARDFSLTDAQMDAVDALAWRAAGGEEEEEEDKDKEEAADVPGAAA